MKVERNGIVRITPRKQSYQLLCKILSWREMTAFTIRFQSLSWQKAASLFCHKRLLKNKYADITSSSCPSQANQTENPRSKYQTWSTCRQASSVDRQLQWDYERSSIRYYDVIVLMSIVTFRNCIMTSLHLRRLLHLGIVYYYKFTGSVSEILKKKKALKKLNLKECKCWINDYDYIYVKLRYSATKTAYNILAHSANRLSTPAEPRRCI